MLSAAPANAKEIGSKNEVQAENCDAVVNGTAPEGYENLGNKSVYRGGNSLTRWDTPLAGTWYGGAPLDEDVNDFANPLPYGDTFVDTTKLKWDNPNGFIIDIQDDRFKWVKAGDEPLTDANGNTTTNDPMGQNKPLSNGNPGIYYVGELQSYLDNVTDEAKTGGHTNVITPAEGKDYLYRITYLDAVTLPNGTRGNLVITMTKVQLESSVTVDEDNPYTVLTRKAGAKNDSPSSLEPAKDADENEYYYDKALVRIQGENQLSMDSNAKDSLGNYINARYSLVKSEAAATGIVDEANAVLPDGEELGDVFKKDVYARNGIGGLLDFDLEIKDSEGNPVTGTIGYATHDLDLPSLQSLWGRPVINDDADKTLNTDFSEGLKVVSGSKSYALTPEYDHNDATNQGAGWVAHGPYQPEYDSPLHVEPGSGPKADGSRFSSVDVINARDANGTFANVPWNDKQEVALAQGGQPGDSYSTSGNSETNPNWHKWLSIVERDLADNYMSDDMKKFYFYRLQGIENPPATWQDVNPKMVWDVIGDASWKTERNDDEASFDTGFAVLLNATKSSLQWSGSRMAQATINTTLFDTTIFTYVESTHGTGGGIYFEKYNLDDGSCNPLPTEGTVTMGRNVPATVTVVPEDGYRVSELRIGNTNYGQSAQTSALTDYVAYTIDGNSIKNADGEVVGTFGGNSEIRGFPRLKTGTVELPGFYYNSQGVPKVSDEKIVIERNADGTVDVTLPQVDNPMHVHADFDADLYFYKVWKGKGEPTSLDMTAHAYGYEYLKGTIPVPTGELSVGGDGVARPVYMETEFTITGRTYYDPDGNAWTLNANDQLERTTDDGITLTSAAQKQGNEFVITEGDTIKRYSLEIEYGHKDVADKSFTIDDEAKYTDGGYVTKLDKDNTISPGNIVWLVRYPTEGVEALDWPEIPIEVEPDAHNVNHVNRIYWFVTEEAPGWTMEGYSNADALAPGVVSNPDDRDNYYNSSRWYAEATKNTEDVQGKVTPNISGAFMSVFKNGGEVVNVPSVIVKGTKTWEDSSNKSGIRRDVWLHLDATWKDANGSTTTVPDVLPAQKIATDAGDTVNIAWGDKKVYDTGLDTVKIVSKQSDLPAEINGGEVTWERQADGSYKSTPGDYIYWVNELPSISSDNTEVQYSIRETLDREGKQPVAGSAPSKGLIGYTTDGENISWETLKKAHTVETVSGAKVDIYSGTVTNKFTPEDTAEVTRTIHYRYYDKDSGLEASKDVVQTVTVKRTISVDPDTGEVTWGEWEEAEYPSQDSPDKSSDGWTVDRKTVESTPVTLGEDGRPQNAEDEWVVYNPEGPTGTPDETWGLRGEEQTGTPEFEVTTEKTPDGSDNEIVKIELLDENGNPTDTVTVDGGKYTLNEDNTITFTPDKDFVGDPPPVKVRGTDSLGGTAETTYTPHVVDNVQTGTAKRTVKYWYKKINGDIASEDVVQTVTFERTGVLNPRTGEVTWPEWTPKSVDEVVSPDKSADGWTVDREVVEKTNLKPGDDITEHVIYQPAEDPEGPKGSDKVTWGLQGEKQNGTPEFTEGTGKITTYELVDPDSDNPNKKTVPGEGTYELNTETGEVTFTPEDNWTGTGTGVTVKATDENGLTATGTYTPNIPDPEEGTATRTIHTTYLTKDGKEVVTDTVQTVTLTRKATKVDPETGKVLEWGNWSKGTFEAFKNPDEEAGEGWSTTDKVGALEVTEPGDKGIEYVVYYPEGPEGSNVETWGLRGEEQKGTPEFTEGTGKITTYTLEGADEDNPNKKTVPGEGVYELNTETGEVTFTPEGDWTGRGTGVVVTATDEYGKTATGTYTPNIPDPEEGTATRTIHTTYLTKDGKEVVTDTVQTVTLKRHATKIDPETGKVLEWGPWEKAMFDAFQNPDKEAGEGWETNDSVAALEVTEPGDYGTEYVVYVKSADVPDGEGDNPRGGDDPTTPGDNPSGDDPTNPSAPPATQRPLSSASNLSRTGSAVGGLGLAVAALLSAGFGLLAFRRRNS
ncbi:MAG: hypothetical protein IKS49_05380 [Actinomycetaceae bacterium]|nr:hypothetical protein [Actinomycetaceae bacterium]